MSIPISRSLLRRHSSPPFSSSLFSSPFTQFLRHYFHFPRYIKALPYNPQESPSCNPNSAVWQSQAYIEKYKADCIAQGLPEFYKSHRRPRHVPTYRAKIQDDDPEDMTYRLQSALVIERFPRIAKPMPAYEEEYLDWKFRHEDKKRPWHNIPEELAAGEEFDDYVEEVKYNIRMVYNLDVQKDIPLYQAVHGVYCVYDRLLILSDVSICLIVYI